MTPKHGQAVNDVASVYNVNVNQSIAIHRTWSCIKGVWQRHLQLPVLAIPVEAVNDIADDLQQT
jgi:hypothetical protein